MIKNQWASLAKSEAFPFDGADVGTSWAKFHKVAAANGKAFLAARVACGSLAGHNVCSMVIFWWY